MPPGSSSCNGVGVPFFDVTVPSDAGALDGVAVMYSVLPWLLAFALLGATLYHRTTTSLAACVLGLVTLTISEAILKQIFAQPRPRGSCLRSRGMPSSHTALSIGFLLWVVLEAYFHSRRHPLVRYIFVLAMVVLLVPVPSSRLRLRDHSSTQIVAGAAVGAAIAIGYFLLLRRFVARHLDAVVEHALLVRLGVTNDYGYLSSRKMSHEIERMPSEVMFGGSQLRHRGRVGKARTYEVDTEVGAVRGSGGAVVGSGADDNDGGEVGWEAAEAEPPGHIRRRSNESDSLRGASSNQPPPPQKGNRPPPDLPRWAPPSMEEEGTHLGTAAVPPPPARDHRLSVSSNGSGGSNESVVIANDPAWGFGAPDAPPIPPALALPPALSHHASAAQQQRKGSPPESATARPRPAPLHAPELQSPEMSGSVRSSGGGSGGGAGDSLTSPGVRSALKKAASSRKERRATVVFGPGEPQHVEHFSPAKEAAAGSAPPEESRQPPPSPPGGLPPPLPPPAPAAGLFEGIALEDDDHEKRQQPPPTDAPLARKASQVFVPRDFSPDALPPAAGASIPEQQPPPPGQEEESGGGSRRTPNNKSSSSSRMGAMVRVASAATKLKKGAAGRRASKARDSFDAPLLATTTSKRGKKDLAAPGRLKQARPPSQSGGTRSGGGGTQEPQELEESFAGPASRTALPPASDDPFDHLLDAGGAGDESHVRPQTHEKKLREHKKEARAAHSPAPKEIRSLSTVFDAEGANTLSVSERSDGAKGRDGRRRRSSSSSGGAASQLSGGRVESRVRPSTHQKKFRRPKQSREAKRQAYGELPRSLSSAGFALRSPQEEEAEADEGEPNGGQGGQTIGDLLLAGRSNDFAPVDWMGGTAKPSGGDDADLLAATETAAFDEEAMDAAQRRALQQEIFGAGTSAVFDNEDNDDSDTATPRTGGGVALTRARKQSQAFFAESLLAQDSDAFGPLLTSPKVAAGGVHPAGGTDAGHRGGPVGQAPDGIDDVGGGRGHDDFFDDEWLEMDLPAGPSGAAGASRTTGRHERRKAPPPKPFLDSAAALDVGDDNSSGSGWLHEFGGGNETELRTAGTQEARGDSSPSSRARSSHVLAPTSRANAGAKSRAASSLSPKVAKRR